MNYYGIRRQFIDICRTSGLDEMTDIMHRWINQGWEKISEEFVIPSLTKTISFDSVADQNLYPFPYDYNGTEIGLMHNSRRLDPVPDETLRLKYEKRTGSMGMVKFYDWSGVMEEDLLVVNGCTLSNESDTVLCPSVDSRFNEAYWVRFDPYEDADDIMADNEGVIDPGDYGYLIEAGGQVSGTSFKLTTPYRGPDGNNFTVRLRPAEQQQFIVYGTPTSSEVDAFNLTYAARPRRLYNDSDVPEWPNMGNAIAYMGISVYLEWLQHFDASTVFWQRAVSKVSGLQRRRERSRALVSDLTIGSVRGRTTGPKGVMIRRYR